MKSRENVLEFYNQRRADVIAAKPNAAHLGLADLERDFDVTIVTQNVDDLHERAGSTNIIHLHGEIRKAQSSHNPNIVVPIEGANLNIGEKCPRGSQLRPHVVFFGENVLRYKEAEIATKSADFLVVIGTSLDVFPAANLVNLSRESARKFLIDPTPPDVIGDSWTIFAEPATAGVAVLTAQLRKLV